MKKSLILPLFGTALVAWLPLSVAREGVVLPGMVGTVGVTSGVDAQGPGTLLVDNQDINTGNDPRGAITTDAANTASVQFNNSSTVSGFVGATGSTFLTISAGTHANTVTFNGPIYSTRFSVAGTGTVNFNGAFTSNTGSTMDFAGHGFINVAAGQTVKAAITNTAGADTGTLALNNNSILDGAVGAASGLRQINVGGGNALITGQANAASYTLGTNTLNVAGAFAIPVAGTINTTIFSTSLYGKIMPVGAAIIGNALQVSVNVTGPMPVGSIFNIVEATSGTSGSTVTATSNTTRYLFQRHRPPTVRCRSLRPRSRWRPSRPRQAIRPLPPSPRSSMHCRCRTRTQSCCTACAACMENRFPIRSRRIRTSSTWSLYRNDPLPRKIDR